VQLAGLLSKPMCWPSQKVRFGSYPSIEVECASLSTVHGVQPEPVEKESAVMTEMLALIGAPDFYGSRA